jgi:cation diffusion facilitator family transporter
MTGKSKTYTLSTRSALPTAPYALVKGTDHPDNDSHAPGHDHDHHDHIDYSSLHERKTRIVVLITVMTMILEIVYGRYANSMALLAEGWHMSTHVFAIGLTSLAYYFARRYATHEHISFKKEKLLALTGFTSAIILEVIAITMVVESVDRLLHPIPIRFTEAIFVALAGLVVNLVSALVLRHDHNHGDLSIRAAYIHVLTDGLTSATAIAALLFGMYYKLYSLDAISGLIGAVVITIWAVGLIKSSGKELIDFRRR